MFIFCTISAGEIAHKKAAPYGAAVNVSGFRRCGAQAAAR